MNLKDYMQSDDSNLFWRLSSGERQNLLDEAIARIEHYQKIEEQIAKAFWELFPTTTYVCTAQALNIIVDEARGLL